MTWLPADLVTKLPVALVTKLLADLVTQLPAPVQQKVSCLTMSLRALAQVLVGTHCLPVEK